MAQGISESWGNAHIDKKNDDLARIKLTFNSDLKQKFMSFELSERLGLLKAKSFINYKTYG